MNRVIAHKQARAINCVPAEPDRMLPQLPKFRQSETAAPPIALTHYR